MSALSIVIFSVSITIWTCNVVYVWSNHNKKVKEAKIKHQQVLGLIAKLDARTKNVCEYSAYATELLAEGKQNEANIIALYAMEEIVKGENIIEQLNKIK